MNGILRFVGCDGYIEIWGFELVHWNLGGCEWYIEIWRLGMVH